MDKYGKPLTLQEAKDVLDVRNTTQHLSKQVHRCKTWAELCRLMVLVFSYDRIDS